MSTFTEIRDQLVKVGLPLLGAALPLPGGAAIRTALAAAIGSPSANPQDISATLASPEAVEKAREFELTHQEVILRIQVDDEKSRRESEIADRMNARKSNVESGTQRPLFWLSILLLAICVGSEVAVLFLGYPEAVPELVVGRVLGMLDAITMMVLSYWYGTSSGSAEKTQLLSQAAAISK